MFHLILFGPPGSGKGTQAAKLVEKYNLVHISTGDLFRAEMSQKTELGLKALEFMNQGILVPDEITIGMLRHKVESIQGVAGFIYDGFPRTIPQVSDDEIVKRILNRGQSSGRADDNDEEIIRKRMDEYRKKTSEVYNYYQGFNKSTLINGEGSIDEIFDGLCSVMDQC